MLKTTSCLASVCGEVPDPIEPKLADDERAEWVATNAVYVEISLRSQWVSSGPAIQMIWTLKIEKKETNRET